MVAWILASFGCGKQQTAIESDVSVTTLNENRKLGPLDKVLGTLLETWGKRYAFDLNREKRELRLTVPNFELLATESQDGKIFLTFEEAGTKHRVECTADEAPKVIEALLFPK